jgi:acyl-coenzyme A thioesterase PaaI-like protein
MHVTEIAIHKLLGMRLSAAGELHILELPESTLLLNHLDSIHAGVQFVLAEACSAEFLLRHFGYGPDEVFAVVRTSRVKFCRPAHGNLRASARLEEKPGTSAIDQLASRGHAFVAIFVEVMDANGAVTMHGRYNWFLRRLSARPFVTNRNLKG